MVPEFNIHLLDGPRWHSNDMDGEEKAPVSSANTSDPISTMGRSLLLHSRGRNSAKSPPPPHVMLTLSPTRHVPFIYRIACAIAAVPAPTKCPTQETKPLWLPLTTFRMKKVDFVTRLMPTVSEQFFGPLTDMSPTPRISASRSGRLPIHTW